MWLGCNVILVAAQINNIQQHHRNHILKKNSHVPSSVLLCIRKPKKNTRNGTKWG
jgi:hypothetical protein